MTVLPNTAYSKKKVKWLGLEVPHLHAHAQVAGTPNTLTNISYWAPKSPEATAQIEKLQMTPGSRKATQDTHCPMCALNLYQFSQLHTLGTEALGILQKGKATPSFQGAHGNCKEPAPALLPGTLQAQCDGVIPGLRKLQWLPIT